MVRPRPMSSMENSERCILPYFTQGPLDFPKRYSPIRLGNN